jgi:hypothetical protein
MITAAITAAVGGILKLFGIEPGPYLAVVAVVVKILLVVGGVLFGARVMKWRQRRAEARSAPKAAAQGEAEGRANETAT